MKIFYIIWFIFSFLSAGFSTQILAKNTYIENKSIVVYSARKAHLIKPLLKNFTIDTGIEVKLFTGKSDALIQRLKLEGDKTKADVLITADAGNLWYAKSQGLFQAIQSSLLDSSIPAYLTDEDKHWFGLSVRARTIVYHTNKLDPKTLSSYQDLADKKYKNRLCLRSSKKVYNKSLVASLLSHHGRNKAQNIIKGWVDNLASPPFAKDSQVMNAILAGQCDIGLVNTYYFGRLKIKQPNNPLALFWANQATTGVHINVSGAGVLKHSSNPKLAQQLLEFLSSAKAQKIYAELNQEYPANQNISPSPVVQSWGDFKHDTLSLSQVGILQGQAVKLMQKSGYK